MEYKQQQPCSPPAAHVQPRLIVHGGAGNVRPSTLPIERRKAFRASLLRIITQAEVYMLTPRPAKDPDATALPTALETATYAVRLFEDDPLFNCGHGAVFTRDGINELEASVMVSRGRAKRGVGVTGLRRVRNPILLARGMLERGDQDLLGGKGARPSGEDRELVVDGRASLDVPSAQGHTLIHGAAAEALARKYGLELVDPSYFFTQARWDEHLRGLEREERRAAGPGMAAGTASWSPDEFVPQGTVGAVALDGDGVVCCATSTGGLTNKLTGRIGDTPTVGAGFWAEEWDEVARSGAQLVNTTTTRPPWDGMDGLVRRSGPVLALSGALRGFLADCLPAPLAPLAHYAPVPQTAGLPRASAGGGARSTRSLAVSGTGNGDSFLRTSAARTVGAMARFGGAAAAKALSGVAGPHGELQRSAEDRWGKAGEGEGGMIGIECVVVRDATGAVVRTRSEILQDFNCGGMFRAWVDDAGRRQVRIFRDE